MLIRAAEGADVASIHALIEANRERARLLPRTLEDIASRIAHGGSFYVAASGESAPVVACGEVVLLSRDVAEVRSLVVDEPWRGNGVGGRLVTALARRARLDGRSRLCAFTHDPAPFVRLGFSIVPHVWLPEKIAADCTRCPLFRRCGQHALVRSLSCQSRFQAA